MDTNQLRAILEPVSTEELAKVIDWLCRPWAPGNNDALRAAWHLARRDESARPALCQKIERELEHFAEKDVLHVARSLGVSWNPPTVDDIVREMGREMGRKFRKATAPVVSTQREPLPIGLFVSAATQVIVSFIAGREFRGLVASLQTQPNRQGRRHGR